MLEVRKIEKRRIPQLIAEEIINQISTGKLQPGAKLPSEKQLEEMFGVSRPSIREALSALNMAEIIEMCHGEGSYVRDIDLQTHIHPLAVKMLIKSGKIFELLETRLTLEPEVAALAAQRATLKDKNELAEILKTMEQEVLAGGLAQDRDLQFHLAITRMSYNLILQNIMENLAHLISNHQMHTRQYSRCIPGRPLDVLQQHKRIFEAINGGNPRAARKVMYLHLEDVRNKCLHIESLSDIDT